MMARDMPRAPIKWPGGIVSPIRVLRITRSLGRMTPARVARANTHAVVNSPVKARSVMRAARSAYVARIAQSMTRPPSRSPSTPNMGEASVPKNWREAKRVRRSTEPV